MPIPTPIRLSSDLCRGSLGGVGMGGEGWVDDSHPRNGMTRGASRRSSVISGFGILTWLLPIAVAVAASPAAAGVKIGRLLPQGERLWLGTTSGLVELASEEGLVKVWSVADGLPSPVIYDVVLDGQGVLWAATSGGPARHVGDRFEAVTRGLPSTPTTLLLPSPGGPLYAGTLRGIARLAGAQWEPVFETHEFGRDRVLAAAAGPDGALWFAKQRALTRLAPGGESEVLYRDPLNPDEAVPLPSTRAQALRFDLLGRLWLATDQGLSVLDGRRLVSHERWRPGLWGEGGLPAFRIWSIWFDPSDAVWLTFGDGPDRGFVARRARGGLEWERVPLVVDDGVAPAVYALASDRSGTIWAGTSAGLYRFDAGRFVGSPLRLPPSSGEQPMEAP
jgi:ligand-binding sensor domain-containing protein